MGIQVEFNPNLALRKFGTLERSTLECLPQFLEVGKVYPFLKEGQRNYWFFGQIPLVETEGNQKLSRPLASITIKEATHKLIEFHGNSKIYTLGLFYVHEVYNLDDKTIHFEGFEKI